MLGIRLIISIAIAVASFIGMVLGTLGIGVLFSVDLPGINVLSASARQSFVFWTFVAFFVSWILFFLERRARVGELLARLYRQRDLQTAVDGLSKLRSEGVNTLFAGTPPTNEFEDWVVRFLDWENRVVEYMKPRFTGAVVSLFSELGPVPTNGYTQASRDPAIGAKHQKYLQILEKELNVMERVIREGTRLVNEPNPTLWEALWQKHQDS